MTISKRIRFEVLKRDRFTCRYCGASAPDVGMHVDHVRAVADGGTDDMDNLVTACGDCNLGKSSVPLSLPLTSFRSVHRTPPRRYPDAVLAQSEGPPIVMPLSELTMFGPIPKPVSRFMAAVLLALRRANGEAESYGALAKDWGWTRNAARRFMQRVNTEGLGVEVVP